MNQSVWWPSPGTCFSIIVLLVLLLVITMMNHRLDRKIKNLLLLLLDFEQRIRTGLKERVLTLLNNHGNELSISEISDHIKLPLKLTEKIIQQLADEGKIGRDPLNSSYIRIIAKDELKPSK
jgi:hypothetical protein